MILHSSYTDDYYLFALGSRLIDQIIAIHSNLCEYLGHDEERQRINEKRTLYEPDEPKIKETRRNSSRQ